MEPDRRGGETRRAEAAEGEGQQGTGARDGERERVGGHSDQRIPAPFYIRGGHSGGRWSRWQRRPRAQWRGAVRREGWLGWVGDLLGCRLSWLATSQSTTARPRRGGPS